MLPLGNVCGVKLSVNFSVCWRIFDEFYCFVQLLADFMFIYSRAIHLALD